MATNIVHGLLNSGNIRDGGSGSRSRGGRRSRIHSRGRGCGVRGNSNMVDSLVVLVPRHRPIPVTWFPTRRRCRFFTVGTVVVDMTMMLAFKTHHHIRRIRTRAVPVPPRRTTLALLIMVVVRRRSRLAICLLARRGITTPLPTTTTAATTTAATTTTLPTLLRFPSTGITSAGLTDSRRRRIHRQRRFRIAGSVVGG